MSDPEQANALVHGVVRDWKTSALPEADKALCAYAAKLTHTPSEVQPGDLDTLRSHGFDDRAIHDATQVIALFNYYTRVADGLGVEAEDFIEPWGSR